MKNFLEIFKKSFWIIIGFAILGSTIVLRITENVQYVFTVFILSLAMLILRILLGVGALTRDKNLKSEKPMFDILATIFTITSISFAFLEIANPPIRWGVIVIGAVIFSLILLWVYAGKSFSPYLITCIGITMICISAILVLPTTNYNYYNEQVMKLSTMSQETYRKYCNKNEDMHYFREMDAIEKQAIIDVLLSDEYFVKNYKNDLLENVYAELRHMKTSENINDDAHRNLLSVSVSRQNQKNLTWRKNSAEFIITVNPGRNENVEFRLDDIEDYITVIGRQGEKNNNKLECEPIDDESGFKKVKVIVKVGGISRKVSLMIRDGFFKTDNMIEIGMPRSESFIYWGLDFYLSIILGIFMCIAGFIYTFINTNWQKFSGNFRVKLNTKNSEK